METNKYIFIFNGEEYPFPQKFLRLYEINPDIYRKLVKDKQYSIKSVADKETFISFLDYLKSDHEPEINEFNKLGFLHLSREFEVMKNMIISVEDEIQECMNDIAILKDPNEHDKSATEEKISLNLDNYLEMSGEELLESPITSVYNIVFKANKKFNDHNRLYLLIKNHYEKHNDLNIFILLQLIDGTKLNEKNLKDAIVSSRNRMNYMPEIEFSLITNLIENLQKLSFENRNLELENQIQDEKIENLKKILFELIAKLFNEYESDELKNSNLIPIVDINKWNDESPVKCSLIMDDQEITVSASSVYGNRSDHCVLNLFNGMKENEDESGTRWASNAVNSAEIIITFKKPVTVNVLMMTPRCSKCIRQAPANIKVSAGNNLENLNLIKEIKNVKWNGTDKRRFLFNNLHKFECYKIEFNNNGNKQYFGLSELNIGELSLLNSF